MNRRNAGGAPRSLFGRPRVAPMSGNGGGKEQWSVSHFREGGSGGFR